MSGSIVNLIIQLMAEARPPDPETLTKRRGRAEGDTARPSRITSPAGASP